MAKGKKQKPKKPGKDIEGKVDDLIKKLPPELIDELIEGRRPDDFLVRKIVELIPGLNTGERKALISLAGRNREWWEEWHAKQFIGGNYGIMSPRGYVPSFRGSGYAPPKAPPEKPPVAEPPKPGRGGKRPGAGRKPNPEYSESNWERKGVPWQ